jgi:AcrR family transcriptional regulator
MAPKSKISRQIIVREALRIVEEEGLGGLSLRSLAVRLDVSPNAFYHHYEDRCALEADVAREGWRRLLERLLRAGRGRTGKPAFLQKVRSFVRFTQKHEELYRLMVVPRGSSSEELALQARYQQFNQKAYGSVVQAEKIELARRMMWSMLHGLMALHRAGMMPEVEDVEEEAAKAAEVLLAGLMKPGR